MSQEPNERKRAVYAAVQRSCNFNFELYFKYECLQRMHQEKKQEASHGGILDEFGPHLRSDGGLHLAEALPQREHPNLNREFRKFRKFRFDEIRRVFICFFAVERNSQRWRRVPDSADSRVDTRTRRFRNRRFDPPPAATLIALIAVINASRDATDLRS